MISIRKKESCCACGACVNICPKSSIIMVEDNEGFLYPRVNKETCVNCSLCEQVCPILNKQLSHQPKQVLAAKNKDKEIQYQSTSGGVFTLIAQQVIKEGGIVFGAIFDDKWEVCHDYVEKEQDLNLLRGSKYIQSRTEDSFSKVESYLKQGRLVLYSGTPCQISGLRQYLRKEYDNLLAIDIVCHGVPSPKVWRKYLLEVKKNDIVRSISFRDKVSGWDQSSVVIDMKQTKLSEVMYANKYVRGFLKNLYLRPSCYECEFKSFNSGSDITLADYWGIDAEHKYFFDRNGVSLVMINTDKGKQYLDFTKINYIETDLSHAVNHNSAIVSSVKPHKKRAYFFDHINDNNIQRLINRSLLDPLHYLKTKLKTLIKSILHILGLR